MKKGKPFDKCFIDADSLIYRIAMKGISLETAKKYYDEEIEKIGWDTCSSEVFVAVKGSGNFRYEIAEDYKNNRKQQGEKDPDPRLTKRRKAINEYAYSLGHHKSDGCEADDIVSIWAQEALDAEEHFVIAHIDKDIDMVEGWHYNYNKKTLYHTSKEQGHYRMCLQMLTGDSTDKIQGIVGVGIKTAEKLLDEVPAVEMIGKVQEAWEKAHPDDWNERLEVCWNLLYMRRNWDSFHRLTIKDELNGIF
jgi:5'-3' exonuclease